MDSISQSISRQLVVIFWCPVWYFSFLAKGSKSVRDVINHAQGHHEVGWYLQRDARNAKHISCVGTDDSILAIYLYEMVANGDNCLLFALRTCVLIFSAEILIHIGFEVVTQTCTWRM